jgi:hypothetical protein
MVDYYKAPSQAIFNDIKKNAIKIWQTYDDTYGYATEKINRIKDLQNVHDNAWYIVAMFDQDNQQRLLELLKPKSRIILLEILNLATF